MHLFTYKMNGIAIVTPDLLHYQECFDTTDLKVMVSDPLERSVKASEWLFNINRKLNNVNLSILYQ